MSPGVVSISIHASIARTWTSGWMSSSERVPTSLERSKFSNIAQGRSRTGCHALGWPTVAARNPSTVGIWLAASNDV